MLTGYKIKLKYYRMYDIVYSNNSTTTTLIGIYLPFNVIKLGSYKVDVLILFNNRNIL